MTEPSTTSTETGEQAAGSEFGSPVADAVHALLADPVAAVGGELIDVEWTGGTLRLVVDAEGGITTECLAEVNRLVSPLLDQHDPVPGRYLLEVSSPGIERPLRRPDHFRRAVGEQVIVKLESWSEIRRIRGELLSADDDGISVAAVEIDGVDLAETEHHTVSYDTIAKARTHFEWGPTPKKGGKNPKPKSSKNKSSNNKRKKR
ncbi:MAG: ribosome maturation factor RimP [Acidimicrobiia bacterium]|nr:ribosome maturation factor RimP [Acidimicrobiia bacterium]